MNGAGFWMWFLIPWALIGVAVGAFMGKRGHHGPSWMVLGVAFGPMLIPAAVAARDDARRRPPERVAAGRPHHGTVDVLLGVDGSPAAERAVRSVGALLGPRLGRVTLAIVVDHDTAWNTEGVDHRRAVERLERAAAQLPEGARPELLVLSGPPAPTLVQHALDTEVELVVIGTRGSGLTKALLGSVAEDLARRATVPVLLVPAASPVEGDADDEAAQPAVTPRT